VKKTILMVFEPFFSVDSRVLAFVEKRAFLWQKNSFVAEKRRFLWQKRYFSFSFSFSVSFYKVGLTS